MKKYWSFWILLALFAFSIVITVRESYLSSYFISIRKEPKRKRHSIRDRTILYVHVGKTAGTTLNNVLKSNCDWERGRDKECLAIFFNHKESLLSRQTKQTYHVGWPPALQNMENTTSLLLTLRDPVSRAISAFNFEHVENMDWSWFKRKFRNTYQEVVQDKNVFFQECFPTVADLADNLRTHEKCGQLGTETLSGRGKKNTCIHLFWNYKRHLDAVSELLKKPENDLEILVIRTDAFWQDVKELNHFVGGNETFDHVQNITRTYGSESFKVRSGLSTSRQRFAMCWVLSEENQMYENLIRLAANLSPKEKEATLRHLYEYCGVIEDMKASSTAPINFSWAEWKRDHSKLS